MMWLRRVKNLIERLELLQSEFGFSFVFRHLVTRLLGTTRFMRPSSLLDFRHSRLVITSDAESFLEFLLPRVSREEILIALDEAKRNVSKSKIDIELTFPENWNSGINLKLIAYSLARLLKEVEVVETGTANGVSADAWATALRLNGKGVLTSIDVVTSTAPLLRAENRPFVELVTTNGSQKNLKRILESRIMRRPGGTSIFLHDSDHSYFGQYAEFKIAKEFGFDILLSDDVDSSMAFLDFVRDYDTAVVMVDGNKMIGGLRLRVT